MGNRTILDKSAILNMVFQNRLNALRKIMPAHNLDSLLLSSREDIFYYTGYKTPEGNLLAIGGAGKPQLFVSPLDNDAEKIKGVNLVYFQKSDQLTKLLKNQNVGYDENSLITGRFLNLHKFHIRLKKASELIKNPREIKDQEEIENIKQAINITKKVLEKTDFYNKSEISVANRIEAGFKLAGTDKAFDTIIANGTSSIHHMPDNTKIKSSKPTIFDLGAKYNWYCSDVTRTYLGKSGKFWKNVWDDVKEMQEEIIEAVRPGVSMQDLQNLYKSISEKKKYKVHHYFGHGIGLDVHEQITSPLKENMVITVEPGVYLKYKGGVRIEDMVLVKKGRPVVLSSKIRY